MHVLPTNFKDIDIVAKPNQLRYKNIDTLSSVQSLPKCVYRISELCIL